MIKQLTEKRAALIKELETMVSALKTTAEKDGKKTEEFRAFTPDEQKSYDEKTAEVEKLSATIKSISEQRKLDITEPVGDEKEKKSENKTAEEERSFVDYLRSGKALETRGSLKLHPVASRCLGES